MATTSNTHNCKAKCEGRCACGSEPASLMMKSVQGTQENLSDETPKGSASNSPLPSPVTSHTASTVISNGSTSVLRNRYGRLKEEDTRCLCHEKPKPTDRKARNKLMVACIIVFVFMISEIVGKTMICVTCRTVV